jgi:septin family protein
MKYLIGIFLFIIIIGILANRELARDKKRIKRMIREYSFRTYSPEDEEEKDHGKEKNK